MDILGLVQGYCKCVLRCIKGVPRVLHGSPKDVFNGVYWVFHGHSKSFSTVAPHADCEGVSTLTVCMRLKEILISIPFSMWCWIEIQYIFKSEFWNWNFKLNFKIEIQNWNSKLKLIMEIDI